MLHIFLTLLLLTEALFALDDNQSAAIKTENFDIIKQKRQEAKQSNSELEKIESLLNKNIMHAKYNNHQTFLEIEEHLKNISKEIKKGVDELSIKYKSLENQLDLLGDFKEEPFLELTKPNDITQAPNISSPFDIFGGFAYLKILKKRKKSMPQN